LLALRRGQRWLLAVYGLLSIVLAASLFAGLGGLDHQLRSEHWGTLAAVVLATPRRGPGAPRLASLAPMLLAGQGIGALVLGATIAGKALLEPGAAGRGWLLVALSLTGVAELMDAELLWMWDACVRLTGLGSDPASLLVRAMAEATRLAGWLALLRWSLHRASG
jgi:hypothetical protein